jgi:hypothetical protein
MKTFFNAIKRFAIIRVVYNYYSVNSSTRLGYLKIYFLGIPIYCYDRVNL